MNLSRVKSNNYNKPPPQRSCNSVEISALLTSLQIADKVGAGGRCKRRQTCTNAHVTQQLPSSSSTSSPYFSNLFYSRNFDGKFVWEGGGKKSTKMSKNIPNVRNNCVGVDGRETLAIQKTTVHEGKFPIDGRSCQVWWMTAPMASGRGYRFVPTRKTL